ncbi:MAG: hypothetical protein ABI934_11710 [Actinomycetota bacterium]
MNVSSTKDVLEHPVELDEAPADTVTAVAAKALRSGGVATFNQLIGKPRRVLGFEVVIPGPDGEDVQLKMKYQAIPSKAYDKLVSENPPTPKEKQLGAQYNPDTFAPALISAVSLEPRLSIEQAAEIYDSPEWSGGEVASLFMNALRVCNAGLDVPFNVSG